MTCDSMEMTESSSLCDALFETKLTGVFEGEFMEMVYYLIETRVDTSLTGQHEPRSIIQSCLDWLHSHIFRIVHTFLGSTRIVLMI